MGTSKCSPCLKLLLDAALDSAGLSSQTAPQILAAYSVHDGHRELLRDRAALERRPTHIQRADLCPDLLQRHAVVVDLLVAQGAFGLALQLELAGELHRNLRGYTQKRAQKMSAQPRPYRAVTSRVASLHLCGSDAVQALHARFSAAR